MTEEKKLYIGLLKWYADDKGFGVISALVPESTNTADVFLHHSNWRGKRRLYGLSIPIVFEVKKRTGRNGYEAINCKEFQCSIEDWQLIFRHKAHNTKAYISEYSRADVLEKCIAMITSDEAARNFVVAASEWHSTHPITQLANIECYLSGGKSVSNPIFIEFLKQHVLSLLSFEQRIELFKKQSLSLSFFSAEEALSFIDSITVSDCQAIASIEPEKALAIFTRKIDDAIANFSFELKPDHYSSSVCGNLQKLFEAFCTVQSNEEIRERYIRLINDTVFEHKREWEALCISIADTSRFALKEQLKRLLTFPAIFSDRTKNILRGVTISYLKKKLPVEDVVWLMLNDGLSIDEDYLAKNVSEIEPYNIENICQSDNFSDGYVRSFFASYVQTSGDIADALAIIKETPRLNDADTIALIKDEIEKRLPDLEDAISTLHTYEKELSEGYIYETTLKYLDNTHNIKPLIRQTAAANVEYGNKIRDIIKNCHILHPDWVTAEYANSECSSLGLNMPDEFYSSLLIQLHKNSGDSKCCVELSNRIGGETRARLENYMASALPKSEYMTLWQEGICNILPEGYLDDYFDDNESKYSYAESWLSKGRIEKEVLSNLLQHTLSSNANIHTQKAFRTSYLIFKFYVDILKQPVADYLDSRLLSFFTWSHSYGLQTSLTAKEIFSVFALFPEDTQIRLFKKLFAAKKEGLLDFSLEELSMLGTPNREYFDESEKPRINLSISVIIAALQTYAAERRFLGDKELFSLVFGYANKHSKELIRIGTFFEPCSRKMYRAYPFDMYQMTSYIFPIADPNGQIWYIIKFAYDENLVADVKSISGRRYHPQLKVWFAPESSHDEVISFAEENKFLILTKKYTPADISKPLESLLAGYNEIRLKEDNVHLSSLKESNEQPPKNFLCEGRESQNSKQNVWWCIGHLPCARCAMVSHHSSEWENYTLLDFCNIFNLDVAEENTYGQFKSGSYALFVTLINKFNSLLEHLYCRECGELLYPVNSNYSVSGATNFRCVNHSCRQYDTKITLNHCYSQRCRGIIDSRDAARCPNGLVICKVCGTCCTTDMFRFRIDRLTKAGSPVPPHLIYKVESDAGHVNHAQFYCFKCGAPLTTNTERTVCQNCGTDIEYNPRLRRL